MSDAARLRRERRNQKILAGGRARLGRIAGEQGGVGEREGGGREEGRGDAPDPPDIDVSMLQEFTQPGAVGKTGNPFAGFAGTPFAGLAQAFSGEKGFKDLSAPERPAWVALASRITHLLLSLCFCTALVAYWPTRPAFLYLASFELALQMARLALEGGGPPSGSILATIGGQLPPPFGGYLVLMARYSMLWTSCVDLLCIWLFVVGVGQAIHGANGALV